MRIFVVGMPGSGNLGDDLISTMLVEQIGRRWPGATVGLLHGTVINPLHYPTTVNLVRFAPPKRSLWRSFRQRKQAIVDFLKKTDLLLIGGGGLFQDSHYRFTVHKWLRYAFMIRDHSMPVWTVGVGFGPLHHSFSRWYLNRALHQVDIIQVRDKGSLELVRQLGHEAEIGPDIVSGTSLDNTPFQPLGRQPVLGCSIRPWPGLDFDQMVNLIANTCRRQQLHAALFAFEHAQPYKTSEYDFAVRLAAALARQQVEARVYCYSQDGLENFVKAFNSVCCAIASRYHANILWQKLGVPTLPLSYAPKVRRLYEENEGEVISIGQIDLERAPMLFQRLPLHERYELPRMTAEGEDGPDAHLMVQAVSTIESLYAVFNGLSWRTRRQLGLRYHRPVTVEDGS